MNILVDFHHNSLLRSFILLFEKRMGMNVYRPIGMDWYYEGYWAINNLEATAHQFLDIYNLVNEDNTPLLNIINKSNEDVYHIYDAGHTSTHKAISLKMFKEMRFDYIIASVPQHIPIYQDLIKKYQPNAKLIIQIGNNWDSSFFEGLNVLASVKPGSVSGANVVYYHQEFDTQIFKPNKVVNNKLINSYINVIQNMQIGWADFKNLENALSDSFSFKSYGGQCRDGFLNGPEDLSASIGSSNFVFHVKDGGDGYGHIIYNAYACGRPAIIRSSFYKNQLAEELFNDNNCIDLDKLSFDDACYRIKFLSEDLERLEEICNNAYNSFQNNVDFGYDAEKVRKWLETI